MAAPHFPEIRPDRIDDSSTLLDSFMELRRKNLESLYGKGDDKSPKGSVDVAISDLVNLINAHPSFVTLSSCSGRIAVFDPKKATAPDLNDEQKDDNRSKIDDRTAKGRGEWILVSHEPVEKFSLVELLRQQKNNNVDVAQQDHEKLVFKHEPLLLHVAACSLSRGRQLLNLALQLGFRESGLVVSQTRVTVAIRSHSLALCVPLSYNGPLRPPDVYLVALLEESNRLMGDNMKKLSRLQHEVRTCLFAPTSCDEKLVLKDRIHFQKLPPLNLWGHDAVVVSEACDGLSIFVFGGYGRGPNTNNSKTGRSNRIYSIRRFPKGNFSEDWEEIQMIDSLRHDANEQVEETTWFGVEYVTTLFSAAEGLQACLLPLDKFDKGKGTYSPVIAIFGGRSDPCVPFGSLLLYEPHNRSDCLIKPIDVRGDIPSPRWGHTLTSLSGKDGIMAILIGGREKEAVVDDNVHILKLIEDEPDRWFFQWQLIRTTIPPQFHHTVSVLTDDTIIIGGGISDPSNLMECFSMGASSIHQQERLTTKPKALSVYQIITDREIRDIPLPRLEGYISHYGSSSCCFRNPEGGAVLLCCGGVAMHLDKATRSGDHPMQLFYYNNGELSSREGKCSRLQAENVSFESMIHHCCLALPDMLGVLILGGGISSFAFGTSFAESYYVNFATNNSAVSEASHSQQRLETSPNLANMKMKVESVSQINCKPVNVVFVEKQNAKALRVALSADNLLNKNYRMIPADENAPLDDFESYIAVPINIDGYKLLRSREMPAWSCMIAAEGQQEMRLSSSVMGSQKCKKMQI